MIRFLKKQFIPGEHNNHQPHILKRRAVFLILGFVLIVEILFLIQMLWIIPHTNIFSAVLSNVLVDLTNIDRQNNNILALQTNPLLEKAAMMKAKDMAQSNYFSHTSPSGKTPWQWLDEVGYNYKYAGENLAVNFYESVDVEKAWMNSAGHRKNILNSNYAEIGIAVVVGNYKNNQAIFVVQYFGRQAKPKPAAGTETSPLLTEIIEPSAEIEGIVMGEETIAMEEESYIAVKDESVEPVEILATIDKPIKSSVLQRIFAMPKVVVDYVYLFIAAIISIALILKFFIKIKVQYPKLVFNGTLVLFVIISILYLNYLIVGKGFIF